MREIDEADLTTAPGSRFEYSNSNYEVLAAMAEAVTATPHAVALRDRVLRPLGMSATTADTSTPPEGLVAGYYPWLGRFVARTPAPVPPGAAGSAMIVSTPRDLAKVVTAHVNDGPELRTALIAARTPLREVTPEASYASGFWVRPLWELHPRNEAATDPALPACVEHDGSTDRSISYLLACPTFGFGVVLMSNTGIGIDIDSWWRLHDGLVHAIVGTEPAHTRYAAILRYAPALMIGLPALQLLALVCVRRTRGAVRRRVWTSGAFAVGLVATGSAIGTPPPGDRARPSTRSGPLNRILLSRRSPRPCSRR